MGIFINSRTPYEEFKNMAGTRFFVDKSSIISDIIFGLKIDGQRHLCITRPRRFGKTVAANMVGAFFGRAVDGRSVFDRLEIAQNADYHKYLNQYDVVFIDFGKMLKDCRSYETYIGRIQDGINEELMELYPELGLGTERAVWDNLQTAFETVQCKFIFVMDICSYSGSVKDERKIYSPWSPMACSSMMKRQEKC